MLVTVNNNSPIQGYIHLDDHIQPTFVITILLYNCMFLTFLFKVKIYQVVSVQIVIVDDDDDYYLSSLKTTTTYSNNFI